MLTMIQKYMAPEGFDYDPNSNLYYKYDYVNEEKGTQTCWITCFNAETGEYTQQIYLEREDENQQTIDENLQTSHENATMEIETQLMESMPEILSEAEPEVDFETESSVTEESLLEPETIVETVSTNFYLPPEGFVPDDMGNRYYRVDYVEEEDGTKAKWVTWFDAQTGNYEQTKYLAGNEQSIPNGLPRQQATLSNEGLYRAGTQNGETDEESSEKTKMQRLILALSIVVLVAIMGITWQLGIFDNLPIPFFKQEGDINAGAALNSDAQFDCDLEVKIINPKQAVIRLEVPNLKSEYPSYDKSMEIGQMMYDWEVMFGDYSVALNHTNRKENKGKQIKPEDMQSSLWKYEEEGMSRTVKPFIEISVEDNVIEWKVEVPDKNFDFNKIDVYIVKMIENGEMTNERFPAKEVIEKENVSQSSFAHVNMYQLLADEDQDYVYTIHLTDPYWKFSMEGIGGPIYRIKKDDKNAVPEKIIDLGEGINTASSIAVMGDYIYFSSSTYHNVDGVDQYAYFRAPKKGGNAEKLFEEEASYIRAYKGKLYFLFREKEKYASYDPDKRTLTSVDLNTLAFYDSMQGGAKSEFYLFMPFSVFNGELYVGGSYDYIGYYAKVNLLDGSITKMNEIPLEGIGEFDEGAVFIYGANPLYLKNTMVVNSDMNAFICRTSGNLLAIDKSINGEGLVFKPINGDGNGFENNKILELELSESAKPYAGVGNWIFLNDRAICVGAQEIEKTIWFSSAKDRTQKWDLSRMKESLY